MRKNFNRILFYTALQSRILSVTNTLVLGLCRSHLLMVCWINSICHDNQLIYGYTVHFRYFYLQRDTEREKISEKNNINYSDDVVHYFASWSTCLGEWATEFVCNVHRMYCSIQLKYSFQLAILIVQLLNFVADDI